MMHLVIIFIGGIFVHKYQFCPYKNLWTGLHHWTGSIQNPKPSSSASSLSFSATSSSSFALSSSFPFSSHSASTSLLFSSPPPHFLFTNPRPRPLPPPLPSLIPHLSFSLLYSFASSASSYLPRKAVVTLEDELKYTR